MLLCLSLGKQILVVSYFQVYEHETWRNVFNLEKDGHSEVLIYYKVANFYKEMGSFECTKGIRNPVLINRLDRPSINTPSTPQLIDTRSALD